MTTVWERILEETERTVTADGLGPMEAAALRHARLRELPPLPSLVPAVIGLAGPILTAEPGAASPALRCEAALALWFAGRVSGADDLVHDVLGRAREAAEDPERGPVPAFVLALHDAFDGIEAGPGPKNVAALSRLPALAEAAGGGMPVYAAVARAEVAVLSGQPEAARAAWLEASAGARRLGGPWIGVRFHAHMGAMMVALLREEVDLALAEAEAAREAAEEARSPSDAARAVLAAVPLLLHRREARRAADLCLAVLPRLTQLDEAPELEFALRNLTVRSLEAARDPAGAIRAGFDAIARTGVRGTVAHYVGFIGQVAAIYHQAGAVLDACNVLRNAERGLASRGDQPEALRQVRELLDAFRLDVGEARFVELARICDERNEKR